MYGQILVTFFEAIVLANIVQVITSDHNRPLHFHLQHYTRQDSSANAHIASKWTFLVNIVTLNGLSETNIHKLLTSRLCYIRVTIILHYWLLFNLQNFCSYFRFFRYPKVTRKPSSLAKLSCYFWVPFGSIVIHLAIVASQKCKVAQNPKKIWTYSSWRSSKIIDLGANRKHICNFLLVISSNFGCISYRFRDIDA